jgi:hypothetical protein
MGEAMLMAKISYLTGGITSMGVGIKKSQVITHASMKKPIPATTQAFA